MPPFLVRLRRLFVAALVIADDFAGVLHFGAPAAAAKDRSAALVERPTYLLCRDLRVFPPAAGPCASPRIPGRSRQVSDVASGRGSPVLRSAASPLPACPGGSCARPSSGGSLRPAPLPTTHSS